MTVNQDSAPVSKQPEMTVATIKGRIEMAQAVLNLILRQISGTVEKSRRISNLNTGRY